MEVTLRWEDVNYSIRRKNSSWWRRCKRTPEIHHILQNVSGEVSTGDLVAIVGASGAGKTTLLAAISRRIRGNKLAGKFTINSREVDREEMTSISGFVPQSDSLINALTVEEHLMFIGLLKYSRKMSQIQIRTAIKKILVQLGLNSLVSSRIGTLSGGERKKLNLATELLGEPYFLFCDEPTTGLDSFNALLVIKTLKNLCGMEQEPRNGTNFEMEIVTSERDLWEPQSKAFPKGVVCSIHQPTSDIFHCFSHIILLREGRIVFQGTTREAEDKFREAGFICPENYNPIEYYVKIIAQQPGLDLTTNELRSRDFTSRSLRIQSGHFSTLWILQVFYLLQRSSLITRRTMREIITRSAIYLITAFVLALVYGKVTGKTQTSIQDVEGAVFSLCTEVIFGNCYLVIVSFAPQLPLIRRETGEKLFSVSTFYTASVLEQIPRAFIESFIFLGVVYMSVGFSGDLWTYFQMGISCSLAAVASMAYGFMISGVFVNEKIVQEVSVPLDTIMLIMGGFYINVWQEIDYIECTTPTNCLRNGTDVLNYYSLGTDSAAIWRDYLGFAIWFTICHILGFVGLKRYIQKEGFY
ncbi:protein brown-like isoform X2 [Phlebotomus papatasi]|uniref:protein brown-like isoform X2 n=1 Tax=Phlebotomus papatasi TaxID=29031 RepID=UPI002484567A|nr:protein brown-like isoform X2 [Phlebotomus papatasi]